MLDDSPALERLVEAFRRLPGIGKRSAERMAYHLLSAPEDVAKEMAEAVREARARVRRCSVCRVLTENDPCRICADERRDRSLVCVVEQSQGVSAIERGGTYRGLYHVLHGALNPLEGIGPDELNIDALLRRVEGGDITEVIVATNATTEGEATALYLSRELGERGVRVTRIAHGVPMGGGLEFSDGQTLAHALDGRTAMSD
jgi:recombination protein RecR